MKVLQKLSKSSFRGGDFFLEYTAQDVKNEYERLLSLFIPARKDYEATKELFLKEILHGDFYSNVLVAYDADTFEDDDFGNTPIPVDDHRGIFLRNFLKLLKDDRYSFGNLYYELLHEYRCADDRAEYDDPALPYDDSLIAYAVDFDLDETLEELSGMSDDTVKRAYAEEKLRCSREHINVSHQIRQKYERALLEFISCLSPTDGFETTRTEVVVEGSSRGDNRNFIADFTRPVNYVMLFSYMQESKVFRIGTRVEDFADAVNTGNFSTLEINPGKFSYFAELLKRLADNIKNPAWKEKTVESLGRSEWNKSISHVNNQSDTFVKFSKDLKLF